MKPIFKYSAVVTKVIDGDTIECNVDLGFNIFTRCNFRLYGIDTPEKTSKETVLKQLAQGAKNYVSDSVLGKSVVIECAGRDKYGRWLAVVYVETLILNEQLIRLGFAKPYFGDNKDKLEWQK